MIRGIKAAPLPEYKDIPHLKRCGVYAIVSPSNKMYIGKSINIHERIKGYLNGNYKYQTKLKNSILKYGVKEHKFLVIEFCNESQLNGIEKFYISFYNTMNGGHGLNVREGGTGGRMSEESKRKMSESKKGKRCGAENPMYGKKLTPEQREHLRKLGLNQSPESRERGRRKRIGMKFSEETIRKRSEKLKGHPVSESVRQRLRELRSKPVEQYDLNGSFIAEFSSAKEAREKTGVGSVQHCAGGKYKQAGGFIWKYKNNNDHG